MKKIGILTFHATCNFGAFLQVYSLSKVLSARSDIEVEVVDYICSPVEQRYDPKYLLKQKGNPLKNRIKYMLRKSVMNRNRNTFDKAIKNYLPIYHPRLNKNHLTSIQEQFDGFIVGSDQVWNIEITNHDYTYFLDFVSDSKKKFSYAASIGDLNWDEKTTQKIGHYLKDFCYLSVREKSGKDKVFGVTNRNNIYICLDPVFLQSKKEWMKFLNPPKEKDYILFFMMGNSKTADLALNFAINMSKQNKKKLFFLSDQDRPYYHPELKHLKNIGPEEFLGYINNASCIISNSFHATAFSILLEKDFYVETNIKRSERIIELLENTKLSDRALVDGISQPKINQIDWENVKSKLNESLMQSFQYIEDIINELNK